MAQGLSINAQRGLVHMTVPFKGQDIVVVMTSADMRSACLAGWQQASRADVQARELDPEQAGPWVVLGQRCEGGEVARSPEIFYKRFLAEALRNRMVFAMGFATAEVVPLALVDEESCLGK